jgi:DNA-binding beta-propeller fold protein YncE
MRGEVCTVDCGERSDSADRSLVPLRGKKAIGPLLRILCALLVCTMGCAKPAGPVFPVVNPPIVWPAAPEQPRIRYVGELRTDADLKPSVSVFKGIGRALFGKESTHAMLTPFALCTDGGERLFVADSNAQVVHVFDLQSRQYQQWKPDKQGQQFTQPVGVAWDPLSRRLYVADSVGATVWAFDAEGAFLGPLPIAAGQLKRPCGLAFDETQNRLFIADAYNHTILMLNFAKTSGRGQRASAMSPLFSTTFFGTRGTRPGEFNYPTNVAVDRGGRVYVSDSLNFRVQQFSSELDPVRQIGRKGDLPGYFAQPKGLALDSQSHLYVVDANFESIQIFNADGALLMDFGQEGRGPGEFWLPTGVFIDGRDRIWVTDSYNRRVQVFDFLPEAKP